MEIEDLETVIALRKEMQELKSMLESIDRRMKVTLVKIVILENKL